MAADEVSTFIYTGREMVPKDVGRVWVDPSVTEILDYSFQDCFLLEEVELCEGLVVIGLNAFSHCSSLEHLTLPSTVRKICGNAFNSSALRSFRIGPLITEIADRTFAGCFQLEEVELCEGLVKIGEDAFSGCSRLTHLDLPASTVRSIGSGAFAGTALRSLCIGPLVTEIAYRTFAGCNLLEEVELCEGLVRIGENAFFDAFSGRSKLKRLDLPSTVRSIGKGAFAGSALRSFRIPDGVEINDRYAFSNTGMPPLVTVVSDSMFYMCKSLFSTELPMSIAEIGQFVFEGCNHLRNVAIPHNAEVGILFHGCLELLQLFGSERIVVQKLKRRFDGLPIHRLIYYHSYQPMMTQAQLNEATNIKSGLDPTGNHQDCLGMTPLHILACSTTQELPLFQWIIDNYPRNLVTKDRWGALPILYILWRDAPIDIVQFLFKSLKSIYPDYELNLSGIVITMGRYNAPLDAIQNLLDVNQSYFFAQSMEWNSILNNLASDGCNSSRETFQFLVKCSFASRLNAIGVKSWRDDLSTTELENIDRLTKSAILEQLYSKLASYEVKYRTLKEATSTLELSIWKAKMNESVTLRDASDFRLQCRISSGSDVIVANVVPFLL